MNIIQRYVTLSEAERDLVSSKWDSVSINKGEYLCKAGQVEHYFYIVDSGVLRLYFENGLEEICLGFSYDHSWSGCYDSFLSRMPSRFFVQALSDCKLHRISYNSLQELYNEVSAMERFGRLILEELLVARSQREIEMMSLSSEERFDVFMNRSSHLLQLVAQKHLASYLRMTPETFSRLRAKK
ncbi:MAG: Crp/Fnr family transcriptional regulator [Flavobacteriales bacterium]|nr:Crp/Fnr family transcriptional regulator [Flavobacteriales bacterium]